MQSSFLELMSEISSPSLGEVRVSAEASKHVNPGKSLHLRGA